MNASSTRVMAVLALGLCACEVDDGPWDESELGQEQQAGLISDTIDLGNLPDLVLDPGTGGPAPAAMTVRQGMGINGMGINGMGINGMGINGMGINGMTMGSHTLSSARIEQGELVAERLKLKPKKGKSVGAPTFIVEQLTGKDLIGAELTGYGYDKLGNKHEVKYKIADVKDVTEVTSLSSSQRSEEWNPLHAYEGAGVSFVYRVQMEGTGKGGSAGWVDACPAAENEPAVATYAFAMNGVWNATTGDRHNKKGSFTFACMSGAIGKCYKWGYRPWVSTDMRDVHQTCTRMARADYCGDGKSHTQDGTAVDIQDFRLSPQIHTSANPTGFVQEAMWGPDGASCVWGHRLDGSNPTAEQLDAMCGGQGQLLDCGDTIQTGPPILPGLFTAVHADTPFHLVPVFDPSTAVLSQ